MKKNTLRNYRNTITINFSERGDNFTLKVPHYKKWLLIIKFLRSRGWAIGENPSYKEHYTCLSKHHKIGHKGNVACLMEIGGSFITVQFGNIKNLWTGIAQSFWDNPTDERYTHLSYLEGIAVRIETKKLLDYCSRFNTEFQPEDNTLSPEEFIINKLRINSHIHGKVTCLEDIKNHITEDSYNFKYNSNDRDKKKIICGDRKYFYDYNGRIATGIVWHNINNMWWVISGNKLCNVADFELFDHQQGTPRRKPATNFKMEKVLKFFESQKDYHRCIQIHRIINKRTLTNYAALQTV